MAGVIDLLEGFSSTRYAVLVALLLGVLGVLVLWYWSRSATASRPTAKEGGGRGNKEEGSLRGKKNGGQDGKRQQAKAKVAMKAKPVRKVTLPAHPLLAAEFKGHTGAVLSLHFDPSGRYLVSCSEDRTIRLWMMKTVLEKEHKYARWNVDLDHATLVKCSPDGTAILSTLAAGNCIQVVRIARQKGGTITLSEAAIEFPMVDSHEFIALDIASTGKFVVTCGSANFTVWTLKGEILSSVETHHSPNTCAAVSPCGKFVACAGFTTDVKIWEVVFSKGGDFQQVVRAMELKGHRASVLSLSFSADSQRMATVSKDSTWKFWDIDVRYKLEEDPKLLQTASLPEKGPSLVGLSPDARIVAVATNTSIYLYSSTSGVMMEQLVNMHADTITGLVWDPSSMYLASAGGADKQIRIWHNRPGLSETVRDLRDRLLKSSSDALKRRIQEQIFTAEEKLKQLE